MGSDKKLADIVLGTYVCLSEAALLVAIVFAIAKATGWNFALVGAGVVIAISPLVWATVKLTID